MNCKNIKPHQIVHAIVVVVGLSLATASLLSSPPADGPSIRVLSDKSNRPFAFEAVRLSSDVLARLAKLADAQEQFSRIFPVYVADAAPDHGLPPIAGSYSVDGSSLRFTPRFSFRPGVRYRAVLHPGAIATESQSANVTPKRAETTVTSELTIPAARPGKPTEVTHIYPSAGVLPENQLKFYIYLSGPMARGEAYQRVSLLNSRGKPITEPFLEIGEELWDGGARRLTIYIEPGRIKQGLKPREDLGPVLEAGKNYTLHVDRNWRDASGQVLSADFNKSFRTGPAVTGAIDTADWKIKSPAAGSKAPLTIKFPHPLDHALLSRTILVVDSQDRELPGTVSIGDEERRWEFVPNAPWRAAKYELVVDTTLEDLAGNRIGQPFEVEQLGTADSQSRPATVRVPFEISAKPHK